MAPDPRCIGPHFSVSARTCSGHGDCQDIGVNDFRCVCDESWTGISHWVNAEWFDCHVNDYVVIALWAAMLASLVATWIRYFPIFRMAVLKFRGQQRIAISRGKKPKSLWRHTFLVCLGIYFSITSPSIFIISIMLIVDPRRQIGQDWASSFLWWCVRTSFYLSSSLFQPALIDSIVGKHMSSSQSFATIPKIRTWQLTLAHASLGALVLVPLIAGENRNAQVSSWVLFSIGTSLVQVIVALSAVFLKQTMIKQLDEAYNHFRSDELKKTRDRMANVQTHIVRTALFQATLYLLFGAVPYLWALYPYLLPISWQSIAATARQVVPLLRTDLKKSSSSEGWGTMLRADETGMLSETELTRGTVLPIEHADDKNLLATGSRFNKEDSDLSKFDPPGRKSASPARGTNSTSFQEVPAGRKGFGSFFMFPGSRTKSSAAASTEMSTDLKSEEN